MKIIIEIPEKTYQKIITGVYDYGDMNIIIQNGTPYEERPHGEWIYHKEWECDGECAFECSKCGMGSDVDYNFCPNCGADMKEGEA